MLPIRVLITGFSSLQADILRRSLDDRDIVFVPDTLDSEQMISSGAKDIADVILVEMRDDRVPALCGPVLHGSPGVKVLAIEDRGGQATLYELRPRRLPLGNISALDLRQAIRRAAEDDGAGEGSH